MHSRSLDGTVRGRTGFRGTSVSRPPRLQPGLAIVADVEAGALELNRRRRNELLDRSAAVGADRQGRIGNFPDPLESMIARTTGILVHRHIRPRPNTAL